MELTDLRCFCRFVEEGTVTKAANIMHMSQPNLSRHIIALEKELGATLYVRDARRAKLTDEGKRLYDYAVSVLRLVDDALAEVSHSQADPSGNVYVGFGDAEAMDYVLDAIVAVRERYPDIAFHLYAGASLTLLERLDKGQLDFVFEVEHIRRPGYHELLLPGVDIWGVYPLPGSPLSSKKCARPEDLENEPLICSRQLLKSSLFKQWAGDSYGKIRASVSMDVFPSNWERLVKGNTGHMLGYLYFIEGTDSPIEGGIPFEPRLESTHALIWKKGRQLSRAAEAFLHALEDLLDDSHTSNA